ncbi:MAG TPA: hypothetical protein DIT10_18670 [Chryseobacterium sp.]|nr:hypothetical protein [Chryseobacterium sp.]
MNIFASDFLIIRMKNKLKIFGIIVALQAVLYLIYTSLRAQRLQEIEDINQDFSITKGVVTRRSTTKGNNVWVKYTVNGVDYVNSDGFYEFQKFKVGDTVKVKYLNTNPDIMITQYNNDF